LQRNELILFDGFKFGMILQLAIGPICLMIFTLASNQSFIHGAAASLGAALADTIFILAAIGGIAKFIQNPKAKKGFQYGSAIILILFGLYMLYSSITQSIEATQRAFNYTIRQSFIFVFLFTLSSPLTIAFWAALFSTKITSEKYTMKQALTFGAGAVVSTIVFLNLVAVSGSIMNQFLPSVAIKIINICIAVVITGFGIKKLYQSKIS
jgi:threonine/homoserine/homoserine lactone efflux protein